MLKRNYELLERAIDFHNDTRGYFYWNPNGSASGRRYKEKKMNELAVNKIFSVFQVLKTKTKKITIKIEQSYSESCKNVYVNSRFFINGKKSTITRLVNIFNDTIFCLRNREYRNLTKNEKINTQLINIRTNEIAIITEIHDNCYAIVHKNDVKKERFLILFSELDFHRVLE
jgi:hypothetical protein